MRMRPKSHGIPETPIIDAAGRILGWTRDAPPVTCGRVMHPEAEALLHGPVGCAYVQLSSRGAAARAGAPPEWREPWRCLAFVPQETATSRGA